MTHRLFIGLRPPPEVRDALCDSMEHVRDARWQSDDQLHITLRYIGDCTRHEANGLAEALHAIAAPSFPVTLDGVGYFERKGRPTALWARVTPSGPLVSLKRKIDHIAREQGLDHDYRKFAPSHAGAAQ